MKKVNRLRNIVSAFACCLVLLVNYQSASAQNFKSQVDSMSRLLNSHIPDTAKVNLLEKMALACQRYDKDKSMAYAGSALTTAKKINWQKGIINAYLQLGQIKGRGYDYKNALQYDMLAFPVAKAYGDEILMIKVTEEIGIFNRILNNLPAAEAYLHIAYPLSKKQHYLHRKNEDNGIYSNYYSTAWQLGIVYTEEKKDDKAINFFMGILDESKKSRDDDGIKIGCQLMADYYTNLRQDLHKALQWDLRLIDQYSDKQKTSNRYGFVLLQTATLYLHLNEYEKALDYEQNGIAILYKNDAARKQEELREFMGELYSRMNDYKKSLAFDLHELQSILKKNAVDIRYIYEDVGNDYFNLKDYDKALLYAQRSLNDYLKNYNNDANKADVLLLLTRIYYATGKYNEAFKTSRAQLAIASMFNMIKYSGEYYLGLLYRDAPDSILKKNGVDPRQRYNKTLATLQQVMDFTKKQTNPELQRDCYEALSITYERQKDYARFHDTYKNFILLRDSVTNQNGQNAFKNRVAEMQITAQKDSLSFQQRLTDQKLKQQTRYYLSGIAALLLISFFVVRNTINQRKANKQISAEKQRSDDLLLNILPADVAEELKEKGSSEARMFDEVSVLFTDFVNFTHLSELLTPKELVEELNICFRAFDGIMTNHRIEKIKTIGDAYLAVAGLPHADENHALNTVKAAKEIQQFIHNRKEKLGDKTFDVRIGIHSGSVVAGIVGVKKFAYDIWGDTVNTAARMEQNSGPGKINVSEKTYELVKGKFAFTYRGEIEAKNKGAMKMYFVE